VTKLGNKGELIAVDVRRVVFPEKCPVCSAPAVAEGAIPAMPKSDRLEARSLYDGPFRNMQGAGPGRTLPRGGSVSRIAIPTCELHAISFEEMGRIRAPASLCNGLLIVILLLLGPFTLLAIGTGIPVHPNQILILIIAGIMALATYYLSSPSALERAVYVYDIDTNYGFLILRISNSVYADEIIRLNPMTAERIRNR
jgi:hypothetical protein